jgi:EAL domain-containing protein (putative c-di-GMP-specific phosphodiesterase class I)/CheY-like chemotaxis protein
VTPLLERFSTMSVLVVDDNQSNVAFLRALLEDAGLHRITSQTDSRLVAAELPRANPDLILLDLHMPYLDGHQVLEKIVAFAAGTYLPVLVLTSDVTSDARDRALAHGARDYLTKPLDVTEVTLRVANLLETRQLYAALRHSVWTEQETGEDEEIMRRRTEALLTESAITPSFQRVVNIANMQTVGYEALARFDKPHERGPAGYFLDAFKVGLGVQLEWLAVTKALEFLKAAPPNTFLALNMGPATILHLKEQALCAPDLYHRLVIELTEHVPIEDYSAVHDALCAMRAEGTRLAADDLGSGYAGFRHLIALKPDIIKLDISLVSGIDTNNEARALASALVAFAKDVGAKVIAEGVERVPELARLRQIGVHWAQGYLLGRPGPAGLA